MQTSRPFALIASIAVFSLGSTACNDDPGPSTGSPPPSSPSTGTTPEETTGSDTDRLDLLFQRADTRRNHVAWVGLDGSYESAPLAEFGDGAQTNPDWSPDGTRVVFAMTDGATDDLFVADAGATEATKLLDCVSPCVYIDDPAWSPDGSRIDYSRTVDHDDGAASTLETVDVVTGRVQVLLGPRGPGDSPRAPAGRPTVSGSFSKWSTSRARAGRRHRGRPLRLQLTVLHLARRSTDRLTDPSLFAATADWSPGGRWIVYSALASAGAEAPDLFRVRARGGAPQQLTQLVDDGGYAAEPTYGPTGRSCSAAAGRRTSVRSCCSSLAPPSSWPAGDVSISGRHPRVKAAASYEEALPDGTGYAVLLLLGRRHERESQLVHGHREAVHGGALSEPR